MRLAVVTNSTYDGLCYNAQMIKQALGDSVEVLHFDEAWYAYAAFHEFYEGRYGMGTSRDDSGPLVFTTHSTHKMLGYPFRSRLGSTPNRPRRDASLSGRELVDAKS